jgi:hypothetical protein
MWVNVVSSVLATGVLLQFVWRRRTAWLGRQFDAADRIVFVCLAVIGANAVISFPYTKDEIMSPAGAFYAVAVGVALRDLLGRASAYRPAPAAALALLLVVLSSAWALRAVGLHLLLRDSGREIRDEWAYAAVEHDGQTTGNRAQAALRERLLADAILRHRVPVFSAGWVESWFGVE